MFQFTGFAPPRKVVTGLQPAGLPHWEICGSNHMCQSPQLIAAYHVLLRLWEPRHPPYALNLAYCTFCYISGRSPKTTTNISWTLIVFYSIYELSPIQSVCKQTNQIVLIFDIIISICQWTFPKLSALGVTPHGVDPQTSVLRMLKKNLIRKTLKSKLFTFCSFRFRFFKHSSWRISESNRWPPACKAGALASWANSPSQNPELSIQNTDPRIPASRISFCKAISCRRQRVKKK